VSEESARSQAAAAASARHSGEAVAKAIAFASVYLRSEVPDALGANRPTKGVLHEGTQVKILAAPLYNDGQRDSGYIWARVQTVNTAQ